jgi:hypothetical protein
MQPLVGQRQDITSILIRLRVQSAQLLHNKQKVHPMRPEKPERNVREYCNNFAFQAVQEFLQFVLVAGHPDIEPVHPVFHQPESFFYMIYYLFILLQLM